MSLIKIVGGIKGSRELQSIQDFYFRLDGKEDHTVQFTVQKLVCKWRNGEKLIANKNEFDLISMSVAIINSFYKKIIDACEIRGYSIYKTFD